MLKLVDKASIKCYFTFVYPNKWAYLLAVTALYHILYEPPQHSLQWCFFELVDLINYHLLADRWHHHSHTLMIQQSPVATLNRFILLEPVLIVAPSFPTNAIPINLTCCALERQQRMTGVSDVNLHKRHASHYKKYHTGITVSKKVLHGKGNKAQHKDNSMCYGLLTSALVCFCLLLLLVCWLLINAMVWIEMRIILYSL